MVVKLFPSIHLSHHPSMDGIIQGRKPPSAHVSLSRKGMPGPGLRSFTMVSCMLLSHRSQAVQTSRFSVARVPMDTCGMWYIERFWKCSVARVPMDTCEMWYIERFWKCSVARVPMDTCEMWYIERFWKCSL
jgi:hypothetical protein